MLEVGAPRRVDLQRLVASRSRRRAGRGPVLHTCRPQCLARSILSLLRAVEPPKAHAPPLLVEAFNMDDVFKIPAPVKRRLKRPLSPQPSTSSAPDLPPPPPPHPGGVLEPAVEAKRILQFIYNQVEQSLRVNDVGQPRSTGRSTRRRRLNRWRKQQQARHAWKYLEAINALEPLLMEEIEKQQSQQILIASALDHFANTVNNIADKFEGKGETEYTKRLAEFKNKTCELREKRRARNPNAAEFLDGPPPPKPKYSQEETDRRLREETEAAVEALLTGDRTKEAAPNNFASLFEAFKLM